MPIVPVLPCHGRTCRGSRRPVVVQSAPGRVPVGADTAVAITGIAGPGGGTEEKPVGTVCWCVLSSDGTRLARAVRMPGNRAEVRDRSTTVGMHMLRRLLRGEDLPA